MNNREDYQTLLTLMAGGGLLGMGVGIMRGIIQQKHGSIGGFIRGIVASIFVAVMVNWGLADMDLSVTTKSTITGICSFVADDILLGLMSLSTLLGRDPLGFFSRVLSAYRGQSVVPPTQESAEAKKHD